MSIHERCSMAYWWPKVRHDPVPKPKTRLVAWDGEGVLEEALDGSAEGRLGGLDRMIRRIHGAAHQVGGFPVFLRTGLLSGKHNWKRTCYVPDAGSVERHVFELVREQILATTLPPVRHFAVRELLELDTLFTAFRGEMPVNVEVRVFARADRPYCLHPYWPQRAIRKPSHPDWSKRLAVGNTSVTDQEKKRVGWHSARIVHEHLEGAWSLDWARGEDGTWWLIDLAPAGVSYHHPSCSHADRWEDPRVPSKEKT